MLVGMAAVACLLLTSCGMLMTAGMMKIRFGCLPEGCRIDTPDGPVAVEDLAAGDRVIGYDGLLVTVLQIHQYREDPAESRHLSVHFAGGAVIDLSPRHRICGVPAGRLQPGEILDGHTVSGIRPITGVSRSFDLLTGDAGYRIGDIPVNSMIE